MSENIFAEIYNRILGLFGQSTQKEDSKDVAINRLRLVLMQDRTNLTPELLQRMRKELIELLSKYVELDKEALELNFEQEGEQMALMLSIPVVRAKDEAEIEEALKAADSEDEDEDSAEDLEEESEESDEKVEETSDSDEDSEEASEKLVEEGLEEKAEETEPVSEDTDAAAKDEEPDAQETVSEQKPSKKTSKKEQ